LLRDFAARHALPSQILALGVAPAYRFDLGSRRDLHEQVGIGPEACLHAIATFLEELKMPDRRREAVENL
jgi:transketolase